MSDSRLGGELASGSMPDDTATGADLNQPLPPLQLTRASRRRALMRAAAGEEC